LSIFDRILFYASFFLAGIGSLPLYALNFICVDENGSQWHSSFYYSTYVCYVDFGSTKTMALIKGVGRKLFRGEGAQRKKIPKNTKKRLKI